MKKIAIGFLLGLLGFTSYAETLWGKTEIGDPLWAVKIAYPSGEDIPPNEANIVKKTGAMLLYRISGVEINQDKFNAGFSFINGKLAQVTLASKLQVTGDQCFYKHSQLIEALKSKYGAPISADLSSGMMRKALFQSGSVSISAHVFAASNDCRLDVYYTTTLSDAAKNL
ncbi:hypothetical protein ACFIQG_21655 [Comamonas odontotermitis]|uniref:hypothetical protein n=1 Tax=Comamonas odontotermitis TaxID=379895 RepID=UPI00366AD9D2